MELCSISAGMAILQMGIIIFAITVDISCSRKNSAPNDYEDHSLNEFDVERISREKKDTQVMKEILTLHRRAVSNLAYKSTRKKGRIRKLVSKGKSKLEHPLPPSRGFIPSARKSWKSNRFRGSNRKKYIRKGNEDMDKVPYSPYKEGSMIQDSYGRRTRQRAAGPKATSQQAEQGAAASSLTPTAENASDDEVLVIFYMSSTKEFYQNESRILSEVAKQRSDIVCHHDEVMCGIPRYKEQYISGRCIKTDGLCNEVADCSGSEDEDPVYCTFYRVLTNYIKRLENTIDRIAANPRAYIEYISDLTDNL